MGNMKKINIKNRTYYFFNDMINIENFVKSTQNFGMGLNITLKQ